LSAAIGHVVSRGDKVDEAGVVAPLYGEDLCDLLVSLEAASPRYGKEIVCFFAGKALGDIIRFFSKK
jgi:hypothetical protein